MPKKQKKTVQQKKTIEQKKTEALPEDNVVDPRYYRDGGFFANKSVSDLWPIVFERLADDDSWLLNKSIVLFPKPGADHIDTEKNTAKVYIVDGLEGHRGQYGTVRRCLGYIPLQYKPAVRLAIHQSVYFLSFYLAGFGQGKHTSDEEDNIARGLLVLSTYYRIVCWDLVTATGLYGKLPVPKEWRWERFDRHLQREMYLGPGVHDPGDLRVKNFQYTQIDTTQFGAFMGFLRVPCLV
jgi:hypothetical protein